MFEEPIIRPTRIEVDLDALRANTALLRDVAGTALYAVVKADAYGHGAVAISQALMAQGCVAGLAVSLVEEGVELRDAGVDLPILVMGPALAGGHAEIVDRYLTAFVSDPGDLESLAAAGMRRGRRVPIHLKVDTGMGRLGIRPEQLHGVLTHLQSLPSLEPVGLATHFACADTDDPDDPHCMTYAQLRSLDSALCKIRDSGLSVPQVHAANTSATLLFPTSRRDLVRCGLGLYGNGHQPAHGHLHQVMRLVSHIAQLRDVPHGSAVSYGALWRARRRSQLAVVPVGYADGVPRRLTGRGHVLVSGRRCPIVGAVSMDISVVDVTDLNGAAQVGAEVVLLGPQDNDCIRTGEFADWAGLSAYEVTCGMSKRVPRAYQAMAAGDCPTIVDHLGWSELRAVPEVAR